MSGAIVSSETHNSSLGKYGFCVLVCHQSVYYQWKGRLKGRQFTTSRLELGTGDHDSTHGWLLLRFIPNVSIN